jgi:hypothetical protein
MADLQKIANMAARVLQNLLKRQAPKKTGALKNSVKVTAKVTANGISFIEGFNRYGIYLDKGTGPYKVKQMGNWNPKPGKGKGGIKPRFWTALDTTTRTQISKLTAQWVKAQAIEDFKNQLK